MINSHLRRHEIACWIVIIAALGVLFSPPLSNLAEFFLLAMMLSSGDMRERLILACRQPVATAALAFYVVISIGLLYSIAPFHDALSMWGGWRKLLLVPLAMAVFDDPFWKRRFLVIFVGIVTLCAVISFWGWYTHRAFLAYDPETGILLRNHSTQGMMFGVAAFGAVILARGKESMAYRSISYICALLLSVNVMLVTPGRSGYIVLLVSFLAFSASQFTWKSGPHRAKALSGAVLAFLVLVAGLALVPTSHDRIVQAIHEMEDYSHEEQVTSMGVRMIFWKNTIQLIKERPILGYGTGAFATAYAHLVAGRPGLAGIKTGDPHNQYMKIITENGLAGLISFLAILIGAFRQHPTSPYRLLGLGVLAAWCATSLANSHFSTFNEGTFIFLWLGVMLADERPSSCFSKMEAA